MFKKSANPLNNVHEESPPPSPKFGSSIAAPPSTAKSEEESIKNTGTVGKSQYQFMKLSENTPEPVGNMNVSPDELAAHVYEDDAWISLNGVVYDVTKYLKHHPGGKAKLLEGCGMPCDALFSTANRNVDKYHPWVNGKFLLQKFKVGNLSYAKQE